MIAINNNISDPFLNHAIEEVIINNYDDECFMLWKNDTCILLGKNQNAYAEINTQYIRENNIPLIRRPTGGGTVYNDCGNLNFSFIVKRDNLTFADFKRFTQPVTEALRKIGVLAEFKGRNDLVIDGKKFSGNAQCWFKDKVLHHGTLLYKSDLNALSNALNVNKLKLLSKSIQSNKSRVTNISDHMKTDMDITAFKEYLFNEIKHSLKATQVFLAESDIKQATQLSKEKYRLHSWNYGEKHTFNILREQKFDAGLLTAQIDVKNGVIANLKFYGDYFSVLGSHPIENALKNTIYDYESILRVLQAFDVAQYFSGFNAEDIAKVIV